MGTGAYRPPGTPTTPVFSQPARLIRVDDRYLSGQWIPPVVPHVIDVRFKSEDYQSKFPE